MLIPNSEIQQLNTNTQRIWYRVGANVTVTVGKGSKDDRFHYLCHTCRTTDICPHARAVKQYAELPKRK